MRPPMGRSDPPLHPGYLAIAGQRPAAHSVLRFSLCAGAIGGARLLPTGEISLRSGDAAGGTT